MDGGSMVKTAEAARLAQNLDCILTALDAMQPDVVFLQEVDMRSARSERINEFAYIAEHLHESCGDIRKQF